MAKKFRTELLDVAYFARPSILSINIDETAHAIRTKRKANSFGRSYDEAIKLIRPMVQRGMAVEQIEAALDRYPDEKWREHLLHLARGLFHFFGNRECSWYATGRKPVISGNGIVAKPPIRGVMVEGGNPHGVLINPRTSLKLTDIEVSFLMRGVHELFVRDAMGVNGVLILDLSRMADDESREIRPYWQEYTSMMSEARFEETLRRFVLAVARAGYAVEGVDDLPADDLFRVFRGSPG